MTSKNSDQVNSENWDKWKAAEKKFKDDTEGMTDAEYSEYEKMESSKALDSATKKLQCIQIDFDNGKEINYENIEWLIRMLNNHFDMDEHLIRNPINFDYDMDEHPINNPIKLN